MLYKEHLLAMWQGICEAEGASVKIRIYEGVMKWDDGTEAVGLMQMRKNNCYITVCTMYSTEDDTLAARDMHDIFLHELAHALHYADMRDRYGMIEVEGSLHWCTPRLKARDNSHGRRWHEINQALIKRWDRGFARLQKPQISGTPSGVYFGVDEDDNPGSGEPG